MYVACGRQAGVREVMRSRMGWGILGFDRGVECSGGDPTNTLSPLLLQPQRPTPQISHHPQAPSSTPPAPSQNLPSKSIIPSPQLPNSPTPKTMMARPKKVDDKPKDTNAPVTTITVEEFLQTRNTVTPSPPTFPLHCYTIASWEGMSTLRANLLQCSGYPSLSRPCTNATRHAPYSRVFL